QNIEKAIVSITKEFLNQGEFVAFGIDAHEENDTYHPETATFPPHNTKGTSGMELYGDLKTLYEMHQDDARVFYFEKTTFSAFACMYLELKIREREINYIHLVGVSTDICILHTTIEAYNKGIDIVVHKDAVASFNQPGHEWALRHFENTLGAKVI